jgi:hypothetical protein
MNCVLNVGLEMLWNGGMIDFSCCDWYCAGAPVMFVRFQRRCFNRITLSYVLFSVYCLVGKEHEQQRTC